MIEIKTEQIEQLIQIIHEQNAWYIGAIGFVIAVIAIFLTFYSFQQKKISDKQVDKFQKAIDKANKQSEQLKQQYDDLNQQVQKQIKTLAEYSMAQMSREGYIGGTRLSGRLEFYNKMKLLVNSQYPNDDKMKQRLQSNYSAVLLGFRLELLIIAEKSFKTDYTSSHSAPKLNNIYDAFHNDESQLLDEYIGINSIDVEMLKTFGKKINKYQAEWYVMVSRLEKFYDKKRA